ncbi:MAG: hypothetical protein EOO48_11000, partial [Flavobacterium sp.]
MKTFLISGAMLFAIASSAQKTIEISDLPAPALTFIEKYFSGVPVKKAKSNSKGFEVKLADNTEIEFRKDGSYREVDGKNKPISTGFIDPKIISYVSRHYPKRKITHIDYGKKNVDVDLTGKLDL